MAESHPITLATNYGRESKRVTQVAQSFGILDNSNDTAMTVAEQNCHCYRGAVRERSNDESLRNGWGLDENRLLDTLQSPAVQVE
jgi:hypothetical protein